MLAALAVTAFGAHIGLPGEAGRVDPATVMHTAPFNQPGVVEVAPGRYEAHLVAGIWFFNPPEIRVPEGSEVTFVATSKDVIHGFLLRAATSTPCCCLARLPASRRGSIGRVRTPSCVMNIAALPTTLCGAK